MYSDGARVLVNAKSNGYIDRGSGNRWMLALCGANEEDLTNCTSLASLFLFAKQTSKRLECYRCCLTVIVMVKLKTARISGCLTCPYGWRSQLFKE